MNLNEIKSSLLERLADARIQMGTRWVLHPRSIYDARRREPGMYQTLRPVVEKAMKEGRL